VQFGDGSGRSFDLTADPRWGTELSDPGVTLGLSQAMLAWRQEHADRTLARIRIGTD
jgi:hypothetical protein